MNLGLILLAWGIIGATVLACLIGSGILTIDIDIDVSFDDKDDQKSDPEEPNKS